MTLIWRLLILLGCMSLILCQKTKKKKTKINFPLLGVSLADKDKPVFEFEGVDIDKLPPNLKSLYTDCEALHIKCLRHHVSLTPVCARVKSAWWHFTTVIKGYPNICEMHRQNCFALQSPSGPYGSNIDSNHFYLQGEGYGCGYDFRRFMDIYGQQDFKFIDSASYPALPTDKN